MTEKTKHILLIEDNPEDVRFVREMVPGKHKFAVHHVDRVSAGIQYLSAGNKVDVVLFGLALLDGQGFNILRKVVEANSEVPVVVLTGSASDDELGAAAIREGADDYLIKGCVNEHNLSRVIRCAIERKQTQAETARMARDWRRTFDASADIIFVLDSDQRIIRANRAAVEFLARPLGEIIGRHYREIIPFTIESVEKSPAFVAQNTLKRASAKLQLNENWYELNVDPILDAAGRFSGAVCIITNITEHKSVVDAIAEKEHFYRTILSRLREDILVIDREYRVVEINNKALETNGVHREAAIGRCCYEILHHAEEPCHERGERCPLREVLESGESVHCLRAHTAADGTRVYVDVLMSPIKDQKRNVTHVIGAGRDVTDLIRTDEALKRRNLYLEALNETTLGLMQRGEQIDLFQIIVDRAAQLSGADEGWLCVFDPEKGDVEFKAVVGPNVFLKGSRFESGRGILGEVLRTDGTVVIDDYHVWPKRAELNYYDVRRATICMPLRYENRLAGSFGLAYHDPSRRFDDDIIDILERLAQLASVALDNTRLYERIKLQLVEQERAAKGREKLQTQLFQAQKMESIGRLTGGVAHDFNNLLTTIIGNADLVREELGKDSPFHEYIADIRDAGERAAELIRRLLAFSRKQVLQPEPVDMNEIVFEMKGMLQRMIGEDIQIEVIPGRDLGTVMADVVQVQQVIMNLAVNARDAMPTGGKLTIETADVELDEEYAKARVEVTPGPYVMIAVSDTGCGIPGDLLDKILEPFFTTKEKGRGTGLGLSTVYGIVKQSGGNIWVYSEFGKGTCFKIYFPRIGQNREMVKKKPELKISPGGSETILVVEDEDRVRNIAARILSGYGYRVLTAAGGQEAMDMAESYDGQIHLLLTDVVMPGMNGKELAGKLTAMRPDMKVIFMSGYADHAIAHHGILDAGANFIQKPFTPDSLGGKVREVLG